MVGITRPSGVVDVAIKPVDFAAMIGDIKVVGTGIGKGKIIKAKKPFDLKIDAEYRFDVYIKPKPKVKIPIKTEARLKSLVKLQEKGFKGFGLYMTKTLYGKKTLFDMRAMGFKGLEIVGGEFPRYMVKPVKIEYYDFLEKGASAEWVKMMY